MRVRCRLNKYSDIPTTSGMYVPHHDGAELDVTVGSVYTVYALYGTETDLLYSLHVNPYRRFPEWYPAFLFDVVDGRLSAHWRYAAIDPYSPQRKFILAFPEWAADRTFEGQLFNMSPPHEQLWQHYQKLIDDEVESTHRG